MPTMPRYATLLVVGLLCCLSGCMDQLRPVRKMYNDKFPIMAEINDCLLKITDDDSAKLYLEGPLKRLDDRFKDYEDRVRKFVDETKREMKEIQATQSEIERWEKTKERGVREFQGFRTLLQYNITRLTKLHESLRQMGKDPTNVRKAIDDYSQKFLNKGPDEFDYGFKELKWTISFIFPVPPDGATSFGQEHVTWAPRAPIVSNRNTVNS